MGKTSSDRTAYAVWATAWGPMAAAAGPAGLTRVILPHYQRDDLRELMRFEQPAAAEDEAAFGELMELTRAYFNGREVSFEEIACDLPPARTFTGRVVRACRTIGYGQTCSYGRLAAMAGAGDSARAAAGVMSRNPLPLVIPCHRVTYSDGRAGGFSAPGGVAQKLRMLKLEAGA